jgi:hypothetical protein
MNDLAREKEKKYIWIYMLEVSQHVMSSTAEVGPLLLYFRITIEQQTLQKFMVDGDNYGIKLSPSFS